MPDINIPNVDVDRTASDLNNALKEVAYVAVGLGVLGFQRAQVRRVELMKQFEAQRSQLGSLTDQLNRQAEPYVASAREQLAEARSQFARLSAELPDAETLRARLIELARAVDEAMVPVRHQLDEQMDRLEESLPGSARTLVRSFRETTSTQERAFRGAVGLD